MLVRFAVAATIGLAAIGGATSASAFGRGGGGSQSGDSWLNDAQKNPRFIEPGAQNDPSRYRASNPREGYYDRLQASGGYGYRRGPAAYPYGY